MIDHPNIPKHNLSANIRSVEELYFKGKLIETLIVDNNSCNNESITQLDLSPYERMRAFEVGSYSFAYVEEVKLIELNELGRVVIGEFSFTKKKKNCYGSDPNRHFYVRNCDHLRELRLRSGSFSDYSVCEIADNDGMEVIEVGELKAWSYNFWDASFELKSDCDGMN